MNESLAEIEHIIETNEREANARREREDAARRAQDTATRAEAQRASAVHAELARDLGCTPSGVQVALWLREPTDRLLAPIWNQLANVGSDGCIEARHVLAAAKILPAVRRDDAIFSVVTTKELRAVPAGLHLDLDPPWLEPWAVSHGMRYPLAPADNRERDRQTWGERISKKQEVGRYGTGARAMELANQERVLRREEADRQFSESRARHRESFLAFRTALVRVTDDALAGLELGAGWWWCREWRRWVAGEAPRNPQALAPFQSPLCWGVTQALGIKFPFDNLPKEFRS